MAGTLSAGEAFAALDAALDAVAALEVDSFGSAGRTEALLRMDRLVHRAEAQQLRMIAVFDARGDAVLDGVKSTAAWLKWRTRTNPDLARRQVKIARRLAELPNLTQAHRAGEISASHLDVVVRKLDDSPARADTITAAEGIFLDTARKVEPQQLATTVRTWVDAVDPLGAVERERELHHQRNLTVSPTFGGAVHLAGLLPPEAGALVKTALDGLCSELYAADRAAERAAKKAGLPPSTETAPTPAQRRADALVEFCRRYLGGGYAPRAGGARPHLSVMVDAATLEAKAALGPSWANSEAPLPGLTPPALVGVGPISTAAAQRLGCDAAVTIYGLDATGRPMSYGRTQRVVPPGLRRYLAVRDGHCRFPGCDRSESWTEAHHLQFWSQGGLTNASNLALICIEHHHALHEGGFTTRGDPEVGTLRFYRPDGTALPGP